MNVLKLEVNELVKELMPLFKDSFEKKLFIASIKNLHGRNSLAFNNFSYAIRELIRHFLHRLSPDKDVIKCSWYKSIPHGSGKITRSDRIKYMIHGGLGDFILDKIYLRERIEEAQTELLKNIEVLNKHTHIEIITFNLKSKEKYILSIECLKAVREILNLIRETRESIFEFIMENIDDALNERVAMDYVENIDELSSHTMVEEIYSEIHNGVAISSDTIEINVVGTIGCNLQYGSRREIELETYMSFPFNVPVSIKIKRPLGEHISLGHLRVNTEKFYE